MTKKILMSAIFLFLGCGQETTATPIPGLEGNSSENSGTGGSGSGGSGSGGGDGEGGAGGGGGETTTGSTTCVPKVTCDIQQCGGMIDDCGNKLICYCDSKSQVVRGCGELRFTQDGDPSPSDPNLCGFGCLALPLENHDIDCGELMIPNHLDNIHPWWCPDDPWDQVLAPTSYTTKAGTSCSSNGTTAIHFGIMGNVFCCNGGK